MAKAFGWIAVAVLGLLSAASGGPELSGSGKKQGKFSLENVPVLTLEKAVEKALADNPDLIQAKAEIERLSGVTFEIRSAALPRLTVEGGYDQIDEYLQSSSAQSQGSGFRDSAAGGTTTITIPSTTPGVPPLEIVNESPEIRAEPNRDQATDEQWSVGIRLTKNIYDGGATRARIEQAKIGEKIGRLQLQEVILDIVLNTRVTFYQILVNRARITVEEQNITLLGAELDKQRKLFEAETVPRFNVLRAEVAVANAQPELAAAKNDYRIAQQRLAKLLAIDYPPGAPFEYAPFKAVGELAASPKKLDLPGLVSLAMDRRPTIGVAGLQIDSDMAAIRVARSGYFPRLEGFVSYDWTHEPFADDLDRNDAGYTAGVRGSWAIWDGFETKGRVIQARAEAKKSVAEREDVIRGVELDVRTAYSRYVQALELLESQRENVDLAEEAVRLAESRFDSGVGTQLDVLDAQTQLNQARLNELRARFDYNVALAEIARSTGQEAQFSRDGTGGVKSKNTTKPAAVSTGTK